MQKAEFLKAIEVGDPPSAAEGLDVDGISTFPMVQSFVEVELIKTFHIRRGRRFL